MLESDTLQYCNQSADSFFDTTLSNLGNMEILSASQYLILNMRCMHELKSSMVDTVAEKMVREDEENICLTDLGQNVLTLTEVMQTFEVESDMFNIKLNTEETAVFRTVILKKTVVQVDGKQKLIVMIRDITDRVRLEQEQIKKRKQSLRTNSLQKELNEVFSDYSESVEKLCELADQI